MSVYAFLVTMLVKGSPRLDLFDAFILAGRQVPRSRDLRHDVFNTA